MFSDKLELYGNSFIQYLYEIIKIGLEKEIIRFIKRGRGREKRLIIADTYLNIVKGFQFFTEKCEHRLVDTCTLKNESCSSLICPEIDKFLKFK